MSGLQVTQPLQLSICISHEGMQAYLLRVRSHACSLLLPAAVSKLLKHSHCGSNSLLAQAAAFQVFQLDKPTAKQPYIKGLLDPCSNSLTAPNIPAEKLYDKQVPCPCWQGSFQALLLDLSHLGGPQQLAATMCRQFTSI